MTNSRIFSLLLLSFVAGIFLSSVFGPALRLQGGIFVLGLVILITAFYKKDRANYRNKIIFGFCILMLAFGVWRSAEVFSRRDEAAVRNFDVGTKKIFSGKIVSEPDRRSGFSQYVIESETLGRVLVKTNLYPEYFYGDVLAINGKITKPDNFSDFDYQNYLAKDDIFLISQYPEVTLNERAAKKDFYSSLLGVKKSFVDIINKILLEPQASFLAALLVGAKRTLPPDLVEAFNRTGTSHIVAISGYNISIISMMLLNFLTYLFVPRRWTFWLIGIGLVAFTLVAGAGASVVRAAIMGGLLILAKRAGRVYQIPMRLSWPAPSCYF